MQEQEDEVPVFFMVDDGDDWKTKEATKKRPSPKQVTLADFMPTKIGNKFQVLEEEEEKRRRRRRLR